MVAMFRNISKHLKPQGRFIGVLPAPEEDPLELINHLSPQWAEKYGYQIELRKKLEIGYYVQIIFSTNPPVEFGNYLLPKSLHASAAEKGGMVGELTWENITLPDDADEVNEYLIEPVRKGYFDEWQTYPDFGILVVRKG